MPLTHMDNHKFLMTEEETFQLFQEFCYEALVFLNVDKGAYPEIINGTSHYYAERLKLVDVDYQNSRIYIAVTFYRVMLEHTPQCQNDAPTVYRTMAYKVAYLWHLYVLTGERRIFESDIESFIFAESLKIIKGVPLAPVIPDEQRQIFKETIGFDPNDRRPMLKLLEEKFGMPCQVRRRYDVANGKYREFVSLVPQEQERRSQELLKLYKQSNERSLPYIEEGELGSYTNPFANVDDAAEYILELEKRYLATDPYRQFVDNEQYFYDYGRSYFRISWASPYVGYYDLGDTEYPCFVANQLSQQPNGKKTQMPRFSLKPSLRKNKFLYRGQAEFYSPCKPSLFREKGKTYFVDDMIQMNELEILLEQHPLVKLFNQGFMLMHEHIRFKINYEGLSQHYYNKTPLLDLTSSMEVAKFFAVTTFNMEKDRYEAYNGDKLGVLYYYDIKPNAFNGDKKVGPHIDTIGKQPFMRSGNQYGFLIALEKEEDFNELPEVRYVYFRHNKAITDRIFREASQGDKYMPQEILRSNWWKRMSDEVAKKRVSTKALKLNFENNPGESHSKIRRKLQEKGFTISSKYTPSFSEEEMNSYYENSLKIWEDFCSDIYFYGPEGGLLKKHLHNLPNDPRYRWAFYR